jgi:hypothetical protein
MLKLDHTPVPGPYIGNVLFTVVGPVDNLLPLDGKLVLPLTMPLGLRLPPMVTSAFSEMSPMPNPEFSAFRHHSGTANGTLG